MNKETVKRIKSAGEQLKDLIYLIDNTIKDNPNITEDHICRLYSAYNVMNEIINALEK